MLRRRVAGRFARVLLALAVTVAAGGGAPPAAADIHAPPPVWFIGSWYGVAEQIDPDMSYDVYLVMVGGAPAAVSGFVDYPDLECGGELVLLRADDGAAEFLERLTYGAEGCLDGGLVTLTSGADGGLEYRWGMWDGNTTVTAPLKRVGAERST